MSEHRCQLCGKPGEIKFSSTGERHAFIAVCGRDDCLQTLTARRFAALFTDEPKIQPNFAVIAGDRG